MSEPASKPAVTVSEIDEGLYLSWRHHPVTRLYSRLLIQLTADYERQVLTRWRTQNLSNDIDREIAGRVRMLVDMNPAEMPFASVVEVLGPDHPIVEDEDEEGDGWP